MVFGDETPWGSGEAWQRGTLGGEGNWQRSRSPRGKARAEWKNTDCVYFKKHTTEASATVAAAHQ